MSRLCQIFKWGGTVIFILWFTGNLYAGLAIEILQPVDNAVYPACATIVLKANPTTDGEEIRDIYFYRNRGILRRVKTEPWEYAWENVKPGFYPIYAKVRGKDGGEAFSDTVYIRVGGVQKGDIIVNGGFDCSDRIAPWVMNLHGTASAQPNVFNDGYFDDDTYLQVEIDDGDETDWYIQLFQRTGIDSGHTYQIYFYADAEDEKTIAINWQENGGDWVVHWQAGDIVIAEPDYYGPFEFVCGVTDHSAEFKFIIGGNDTDIFLDSISIVDLNATDVKDKTVDNVVTGFDLYPAFPNPFNMHTVIRYELPRAIDVVLDIYNMQGRKVRSLVSGTQSQGGHTVTWDGADDFGVTVSSGVYVYRMRATAGAAFFEQSRKVLLLK